MGHLCNKSFGFAGLNKCGKVAIEKWTHKAAESIWYFCEEHSYKNRSNKKIYAGWEVHSLVALNDEAPCGVCSRMNDTGVNSCWWCGSNI